MRTPQVSVDVRAWDRYPLRVAGVLEVADERGCGVRVLVGCERSGVVRRAFEKLGCYACSCDLEPADDDGNHFQRDLLGLLTDTEGCWDLVIAHPPYTYLARSGLHWNRRVPGRASLTKDALRFVRSILECGVPRICVENPPGRIGTAIRPANQYIQPYEFGHDAAKKTGLWLVGLPLLVPTGPRIAGRMVGRRERWSNQTDSGQDRIGPSADRANERSRTYDGIAKAMAMQWGRLI